MNQTINTLIPPLSFELRRIFFSEEYTIGKLYINGIYFCDTIEDKVRDLNEDGDLDDLGETKVWGKTAIPYGTYKFIMSFSQRFQRVLPRLLNVKGFDGILIHSGNTAIDTHGCILVGVNSVKGKVLQSKITMDKLLLILNNSKQKQWEISVVNGLKK